MHSTVECQACGCKGTAKCQREGYFWYPDPDRTAWREEDIDDVDARIKATTCPHEEPVYGPPEDEQDDPRWCD